MNTHRARRYDGGFSGRTTIVRTSGMKGTMNGAVFARMVPTEVVGSTWSIFRQVQEG